MAMSTLLDASNQNGALINSNPDLYIYGVGVEYPANVIKPQDLATLAKRFYPSSPA